MFEAIKRSAYHYQWVDDEDFDCDCPGHLGGINCECCHWCIHHHWQWQARNQIALAQNLDDIMIVATDYGHYWGEFLQDCVEVLCI